MYTLSCEIVAFVIDAFLKHNWFTVWQKWLPLLSFGYGQLYK